MNLNTSRAVFVYKKRPPIRYFVWTHVTNTAITYGKFVFATRTIQGAKRGIPLENISSLLRFPIGQFIAALSSSTLAGVSCNSPSRLA